VEEVANQDAPLDRGLSSHVDPEKMLTGVRIEVREHAVRLVIDKRRDLRVERVKVLVRPFELGVNPR